MSESLQATSTTSDLESEDFAAALEDAQQRFFSTARSFLVERNRFANLVSGFDTFNGARRMFNVLGYPERLTLKDYQDRFERGGIAKRIVSCGPKSMGWTKLVVIENNDPKNVTQFETQWNELFDRTNLGSIIERADIMAGIGEYAAIYIGVKERGEEGNKSILEQPISKLTGPEDVVYFRPLGQDQAEIVEYIGDSSDDKVSDPLYGMPKFYSITLGGDSKSSSMTGRGSSLASVPRKVHYSRIIHVTHEPLSNELFSAPELQAVWNYLCDLDKLVGGGAEITWKQALQKTLYDLDKDIGPDGLSASKSGEPGRVVDTKKVAAFQESLKKLSNELEEMEHNLRNSALSRGVTPKTIDTKVTDSSASTKVILSLIAATVEKPQRVLFGTEAGQLGSSQDEDTDDDYTESRRDRFGAPLIKQIVNRLISFGGLVKPKKHEPVWATEEELNEMEKAEVTETMTRANVNQYQADGTIIYTSDEIRDRNYQWEPLPKPEIVEPPPTVIDPEAVIADPIADPTGEPSATNV